MILKNLVRKPTLLSAACALIVFCAAGQGTNTRAGFIKGLEKVNQAYPPEKVFIHTDKTLYQAGENMWFKVWHTEGKSDAPSQGKVIVKLDLHDPYGSVVQTHLLQCREGKACGSLLFSDTLPEGEYELRAYSQRMYQLGPGNVHSRQISLVNPKNSLQSRKAFRKSKAEDFRVDFFPEGGHLLGGVNQRLAVRIHNGFNEGVSARTRIVDPKGTELGVIQTAENGIGSSLVTLEAGEKYVLEVPLPGGKKESFRLPEAELRGMAIAVSQNRNSVHLRLKQAGGDEKAMILLQAPGGEVSSFEVPGKSGEDSLVELRRDELEEGLYCLVALNNDGLPVSERMFCVTQEEKKLIKPQIDRQAGNDTLTLELQMPRILAQDEGSVSLSVVRSNGEGYFISRPPLPMVLEFLVGHALDGIEGDPALFLGGDEKSIRALDDLLMVNTWTRYDWDHIAQGKLPNPDVQNSGTLGVSGKVKRTYLDLPAEDVKVQMTVMDEYYDQFTAITGADGRFSFPGLEYEDTINILLEARWKGDKKNLLIEVDKNSMETRSSAGDFSGMLMYTDRDKVYDDAKRMHRKYKYARKKRRVGSIHGDADHVVRFDQVSHNYRSPLEALQTVPGVDVQGSGMNTRVFIRGSNSFVLSNEPLFVLDDVQVDRFTINSLYAGDVEKIEILSGTRAAIYGAQGANGVVAVYTKKAGQGTMGEIGIKMLGFTGCKSFYRPVKGPDRLEGIPETMAWQPMLTPDEQGRVKISFPHVQEGESYEISVEALSKKGKVFSSGLLPLP